VKGVQESKEEVNIEHTQDLQEHHEQTAEFVVRNIGQSDFFGSFLSP
jgi:hypothetical protein